MDKSTGRAFTHHFHCCLHLTGVGLPKPVDNGSECACEKCGKGCLERKSGLAESLSRLFAFAPIVFAVDRACRCIKGHASGQARLVRLAGATGRYHYR